MPKTRVLLIGRTRLILDGFRCLLQPPCDVQLAPADAQAVVAAVAAFDPKVALIDLEPGETESETARVLATLRPPLPVLCLVGDGCEPVPGLQSIEKKVCTGAALLEAVLESYSSRAKSARKQSRDVVAEGRPPEPADWLTSREHQVLRLLIRGLTIKEVAKLLNISTRSVAYHKYRVMNKHGLQTTDQLIAFAKKSGFDRL